MKIKQLILLLILLCPGGAHAAKRWVVSPLVNDPERGTVPKVALIVDPGQPCTPDCGTVFHSTVAVFADYAVSQAVAIDFTNVDADAQVITLVDYDSSTEDATFGTLPAQARNKINTFLSNRGMQTIANDVPLWQIVLKLLQRKFPGWTREEIVNVFVDDPSTGADNETFDRGSWLASIDGMQFAQAPITFFNDPFVEDSADTDLVSHNPANGGGTGTGWTEEIGATPTLQARFSGDTCRASANELNNGLLYTADNSGATLYPDQDAQIDCVDCSPALNTHPSALFLRYQSTTRWYSCQWILASVTSDFKVYEKVSSSAATEMASGDYNPADADVMKCTVSGTSPPVVKFYQNDILRLTGTDDTGFITAAGKAGIGMGATNLPTHDITSDWILDDFVVTTYAPSGRRRTIIIGEK